jgi:hypothetical protein
MSDSGHPLRIGRYWSNGALGVWSSLTVPLHHQALVLSGAEDRAGQLGAPASSDGAAEAIHGAQPPRLRRYDARHRERCSGWMDSGRAPLLPHCPIYGHRLLTPLSAERFSKFHTEEVTGSIPVSPTQFPQVRGQVRGPGAWPQDHLLADCRQNWTASDGSERHRSHPDEAVSPWFRPFAVAVLHDRGRFGRAA